jgi:magnesium chelatase accessory protein
VSGGPDWARQGRDWPNRAASRFVEAGGLRWHVQIMGEGPALLLLHGTGASTHSMRALLPALAARFTVIAPDLPGHGFTSAPASAEGSTLPGMARGAAALLRALDAAPSIAAGHSAGAPVIAQMALDGLIAPAGIVGMNAAILPLRGAATDAFAPLARAMVRLPGVPRLFAWHAGSPATVRRLIGGTGSTIDAEGMELYRRLAGSPGHVAGALAMMANWDLKPLVERLRDLEPALLLIVGERDRAIPPADARIIRTMLPRTQVATLPGLGHLAHEEQPGRHAELIEGFARELGVLPA